MERNEVKQERKFYSKRICDEIVVSLRGVVVTTMNVELECEIENGKG